MSATEQSHSEKVKAGMELSRQHKAGQHTEFVAECARCKAEAKEHRNAPAAPPRPDRTGHVSLSTFSPGDELPDAPVIGPDSAMYVEKPPPKSEEKSPEQKEREHQAAMKAASEADQEARITIPPVAGKPGEVGGDKTYDRIFHVLQDGFTALGTVWYRGQEIGIKDGSALDELSRDRNGNAWYEMSAEEQMRRNNGVQQFAEGPWPFDKTDVDSDDEYLAALASSDPEAVRRYEKKQQRQQMPAAPVSSGVS